MGQRIICKGLIPGEVTRYEKYRISVERRVFQNTGQATTPSLASLVNRGIKQYWPGVGYGGFRSKKLERIFVDYNNIRVADGCLNHSHARETRLLQSVS